MPERWDTVLTLVRAVLDAEWTETSVGYQNEDLQTTPGNPWVYAEVLGVDGDGSLFGSAGKRVKSELGLIACHVFVPTGTGTAEAYRLAEDLGEMLTLRNLADGAVTAHATISGAGSGDDEGNWFRVVCSVPVGIHGTV